MSETTKLKLIKQEDGAMQWGKELNTNFDLIDSGVVGLHDRMSYDLKVAGLYKAPTFTLSDGVYIIKNVYAYFTKTYTNATDMKTIGTYVNTDVGGITLTAPTSISGDYGIFKYYLHANGQSSVIIACNPSSTEDILDGSYIYLATLVYKKENDVITIVNELSNKQPWFSNTSLEERTSIIKNKGILTGGDISYSNNGLIENTDSAIAWNYEGINYSDSNRNYNYKTFNQLTGNINFYKAYEDGIISASELVIGSSLDATKYGSGSTVSTNYYTVQRYAASPNGVRVVFYGLQQYATLQEAQIALNNLNPINASIPVKEIARIIIQNKSGSIPTIINLNSINIGENLIFKQDPAKESYTVGDAIELRSNGFMPNISITENSGILTVSGSYVSISNGAFVYNNINSTLTLGTDNEWYTIYLNNGVLDEIKGEPNSDYIVGYHLGSNLLIKKPSLCTTREQERCKFKAKPIEARGGRIINQDTSTNKYKLQQFDKLYLYAEGIYNNSKYSYYNEKPSGAISSFIEIQKTSSNPVTFSVNTVNAISTAAPGKYRIDKIYSDTNGNIIVMRGEEVTTNPEIISGYETAYLPYGCFVELGRAKITGETNIEFVYTNQTYVGDFSMSLAVISGNAATADKLSNARTITLSGDASGSASFDGSNNITIQTTVSNATNATTATNASSATSAQNLNNLTVGSATAPVYFNGGVPTACADTLGVNISGNAVKDGSGNTIADTYARIFKGNTAPSSVSGCKAGDIYIETTNNYVYFCSNKTDSQQSWILLNSWQ